MNAWTKSVEGERKFEGKRKGQKEREEEKSRERLLVVSRFPEDPTIGFLRSKRQSLSTRRGLRIETKIWEFHQALRVRGFSYSVLFLA